MVLPSDDHMSIRGHGVFDTATVCNGKFYRFNTHFERFMNSAKRARIELPFEEEIIKQKITHTVAHLQLKNAFVRYFLSAGPGDYSWLPYDCKSALYVVVSEENYDRPILFGPEYISKVPLKSYPLTEIKTNNYLMNTLMSMEAIENGGKYGVWINNEGYLAEGCVANVIIVHGGVLKTPPFQNILRGCSARRILDFGKELVEEGLLKDVAQVPIREEELYEASEMLCSGGDTHLKAITELRKNNTKTKIFGSKPGPVTQRIYDLIVKEAKDGNSENHLDIPYELYQ